MQSQTIKDRFIFTVVTKFLKSGLSFFTAILLARWLGPNDFGRMAFLIGTFMALRVFFDMSSSTAFFTFLSQKKRSSSFVLFYWIWVAFQLISTLIIVYVFIPQSIFDVIWQDEDRRIVLLALLATFIQMTVWPSIVHMAEAARETQRIQTLALCLFFVHLIVLVLVNQFGEIALNLIFIVIIIEWSTASVLGFRLYKSEKSSSNAININSDEIKTIFRMYLGYCLPLIPYAWIGFLHDFGDKWMLQAWGGAEQQAYMAVGIQISGLILFFTTAILHIFWKEIAEAFKEANHSFIKGLYQRVTKSVYFLSCVLAGSLVPWAELILSTLLGSEFIIGSLVLGIMLCYPLHQSIQQINFTLLYATENSVLQMKLGIFFMILSILGTYFVLAPKNGNIPGLSMGASGLALKMVIIQIIAVNTTSWFIAKKFKWKNEFMFQIYCSILCLSLGYLCFFMVDMLLPNSELNFISFCLSIAFYGSVILLMVYFFPGLAGLKKIEVERFKNILMVGRK